MDRLLYVFVVVATLPDSTELAPPALMVFGRLPDGHELHAYVLRESPTSKSMAAIMLRMWGDIPPQHVVELEDAALAGKRAYMTRSMQGLASSLCVVRNPHYPEPDYAKQTNAPAQN